MVLGGTAKREADEGVGTSKMTGAKYNETYKKVSTMGEKLKAAGKQGPSNDEQLHVRLSQYPISRRKREKTQERSGTCDMRYSGRVVG
jgi:hypothetical protein